MSPEIRGECRQYVFGGILVVQDLSGLSLSCFLFWSDGLSAGWVKLLPASRHAEAKIAPPLGSPLEMPQEEERNAYHIPGTVFLLSKLVELIFVSTLVNSSAMRRSLRGVQCLCI